MAHFSKAALIFSGWIIALHTSAVWAEEQIKEKLFVSVGNLQEEEKEELACRDRDINIPTLYDRNRMELMRQRDRWLLHRGKCWPPPGVLVSPQIVLPPADCNGCYEEYDPRNRRYRR